MRETYDRALLRNDLRRDEGEVLHAYQDSLGYWTIGVGRLIDKRKGGKISIGESAILLDNDIDDVEDLLDMYLPWWRSLDAARQGALANMAFNLGVGPSAENPEGKLLTFKNTLASLQAGNYEAAARGMMQSRWASQVGARATRLAFIIRGHV